MRDTFWSRQGKGSSKDQRTFELNVAACRLMLDIMPGLDTSAVFQVKYQKIDCKQLILYMFCNTAMPHYNDSGCLKIKKSAILHCTIL
jgi:hypothetical protein